MLRQKICDEAWELCSIFLAQASHTVGEHMWKELRVFEDLMLV